MRSVNSRIFLAMITVAVCTGAVKLAGLAKIVVVANRFGTGDDMDAWLIAFLVPAFIADSVAGSVSASLVPAFVELREREGVDAAQRLFSSVTTLLLTGLVLLSLLAAWQAPAILSKLARGFDERKLALTVSLMHIMIPIAVFGGIAAVWRGILNAGEHFALAAITPVLTPLAAISFLLLAGRGLGVRALAFGTVCGAACEMFVVGFALWRQRFPMWLRWHGFDPALKGVFSQYAPMIGATIVMGASVIVDQSMAASLGAGSVSILNYGFRLVAFVTAMGPTVVSTAVFPHFSRMVAVGDWDQLRHSLKTVLGTLLLCSVPVTIVLLIFSEPLVRVILQRGAFAEADTKLVAAVQRMALLQIPLAVLIAPMARLVSALKANQHLLWAALIHLLANVVLDYILMRAMGVAGIALATLFVAFIYFCYLGSVLSIRLKARRLHEPGRAPCA